MGNNFNEDEEFRRIMSLTNEEAVSDLEDILQALQVLKAQLVTRRLQMDNERIADKLEKTHQMNNLYDDMLIEAQQRLTSTDEKIAVIESVNPNDIENTSETNETQETADTLEQPYTNTDSESVVSSTDTDSTSIISNTSYTDSLTTESIHTDTASYTTDSSQLGSPVGTSRSPLVSDDQPSGSARSYP